MSSPPKINNHLPQPLSVSVERVLQAMFTGYREVIVLSEFTSGLSGSRVLRVRPIQANGPELPAVVKIDTAAAVMQEWQAYQTCIRNRLPAIAAIQDEPVFPPGNPLGGLRYGLAGEGVFDVVSLGDYCEKASPEQIERILSRLFQAMAALWEQKDVQAELYLQTAYDSFVPVNLNIELVTTPTERESKWLHPTTARHEEWPVGDVVQLAGFQPVEIVQEKNRILFNSPDSDQAFRFYLTGVTDVTSYNIGRVVERPITGIIKETRHTLLTQQVQKLLQESKLTAPTLILDDGLELPNPLIIYPTVLSRSFDAHVACIHGDLHLQNVLVEPDNGNSYLIDFGKSRQDHVLRDLLHLEMSVVTGLLPHYLDKEEFSPSHLADFYTRLHCVIQHPEKVPAPDKLQRPFVILQQVRKAAKRYLFKDWKEYYDTLGLYLLSALKFGSLDRFAKEVAFWGSAMAFQLSQNNLDCTAFIEGEKHMLNTPSSESEKSQLSDVSLVGVAQGDYQAPPTLPQTDSLPANNLPPKAYHQLIGRSEEQDEILGALRTPDKRPIVVVVGLGGMGKTAIARETAAICQQEALFDHIVWTSAKTEHFVGERIVSQNEVVYDFDVLLSEIARQCHRIDMATMPLEQKTAAITYLLSEQRVLIVLDNLETIPNYDTLVQQIAEILGQSKLLITSRYRVNHERAFTIGLQGFPDEEGIAFLRAEGQERNVSSVVDAPTPTLLQIQQDTGGAPLAMKLVIGQLSRQPMDVVLQSLKEASAQGQDYEFYSFVYWHSWNLLDQPGQMALVDMSVFPPTTGGARDDVEAVSQLEAVTFWPAMDQLVTMSLVDKTGSLGQERFALHPLTHYFILADITEEWKDDDPQQ